VFLRVSVVRHICLILCLFVVGFFLHPARPAWLNISFILVLLSNIMRGRRGRYPMIDGFTNTCEISADRQ
jgi:hypothetical protein